MSTHADLIREAMAAHKAGRYAEAEAGYRVVLRDNPADAKAHYFLGLLHFHRGNMDAATDSVAQALSIAPGNAQAWNTFGGMLVAAGRVSEAKKAYEQAASVAPQSGEGWYNLGICLRDEGDVEGAIQTLREATKRDPNFHRSYGALAALLYQTGELKEASSLYVEWAARDPSNPYAAHMVAASTGQNTPERASNEYVKTHFDEFAPRFDASLARLEYKAPALVAEALANARSEGVLVALDAGCGTGLCGPLIRGACRTLVGVDLSEQMLARAKARDVYDELVTSELSAFMRSRPNAFDAVVAADTLCYFGVLAEPLEAARAALNSQGVLIITLETLVSRDVAFNLEPHGRYTHSESYVRRELARAGFEVKSLAQQSVRREGERDVPGWLVVAQSA